LPALSTVEARYLLMTNSHTFLEQLQAYLRLQQQISKAIHNRDEGLLARLKQGSQELFAQLDAPIKGLNTATISAWPNQSFSQSDLAPLVQLMEQAQRQVQENETALQAWLGQMKADIQHYRTSQSQRGVLATYVQQRQAGSHRTTEFEGAALSPESVNVVPSPTIPSSPWVLPSKDPETVGHQVNQQS